MSVRSSPTLCRACKVLYSVSYPFSAPPATVTAPMANSMTLQASLYFEDGTYRTHFPLCPLYCYKVCGYFLRVSPFSFPCFDALTGPHLDNPNCLWSCYLQVIVL